jgi:hypothetical protein
MHTTPAKYWWQHIITHDAVDSSVPLSPPPIISLFTKFSKTGLSHLSDCIIV